MRWLSVKNVRPIRIFGCQAKTANFRCVTSVINLFVSINSTGKKLTGAEQRHAKYFRSEFLREARKLAQRYEGFFLDNRIMSSGQVSRMKHVEVVCELLASIYYDGPINKKKVLDDVIGGQRIDRRSTSRCNKEFIHTLNLIKRMFPDLRATRLSKIADFYSLFLLIYELNKEGCVLTDKKRNAQAKCRSCNSKKGARQ